VTVELAREVAARIGALDGVVAVTLGGSLARGRADPRSDVDLGLYYDPARPFPVEGLRVLVTELDDGHAPEVVGVGEWGPWINGGAWTRIRDTRVDLLYRDLRLVDRVLDDCAAGRRSRTSPYPPALRREVVRRYLWEADFAVQTAHGAAGRGDLAYVSGCLFRAVACLVQVLFALNERWFLNEKGAVGEADELPRTPPGFAAGVDATLSGLGPEPATLEAALQAMAALTAAVRQTATSLDCR
jgi:hypothetical protein